MASVNVSGWRWCIPPVRWLQRYFVPPRSDDWDRIAYQPMLYLATFLAALTVLVFGDFVAFPPHQGIETTHAVYWMWLAMSLGCPLLGLGSLWLIQNRVGKYRYRGLWLRLAADIGQFTTMLIYVVLRLTWGDYHIYPVAVLVSATLFVGHLVIRDVRRLAQVERLAFRLHRDGHGGQ